VCTVRCLVSIISITWSFKNTLVRPVVHTVLAEPQPTTHEGVKGARPAPTCGAVVDSSTEGPPLPVNQPTRRARGATSGAAVHRQARRAQSARQSARRSARTAPQCRPETPAPPSCTMLAPSVLRSINHPRPPTSTTRPHTARHGGNSTFAPAQLRTCAHAQSTSPWVHTALLRGALPATAAATVERTPHALDALGGLRHQVNVPTPGAVHPEVRVGFPVGEALPANAHGFQHAAGGTGSGRGQRGWGGG
jgi:hypothetical protein